MSALFIPMHLGNFSGAYLHMEAAGLPEETDLQQHDAQQTTQATNDNNILSTFLKRYDSYCTITQLEEKGMSSFGAFFSIFRNYVCPLALKLFLVHLIIKVIFSLSWPQVISLWAVITLRCLITPDSEMQKKAPSLLKAQTVLHKVAWMGTIMTNLAYASTTPSPVNIAAALTMLITPVLHHYNGNALVEYINKNSHEREDLPEVIFRHMKNIQANANAPERLKRMLKFRIFHCIPALAVTTLCALAPLQIDPLRRIFAAVTFLDAGYASFWNVVDLLNNAYSVYKQPQRN